MLYFTIWPMALAVIFMVIVPLCAAGVIRANRFVGIRWPVIRASEEAWQRGHRAAIAPVFIGGFLCIAAGIGLSFVPNSGALAPIGAFVFLLGGFGIASSRAQRAAA
jgi:hypothetical protein